MRSVVQKSLALLGTMALFASLAPAATVSKTTKASAKSSVSSAKKNKKNVHRKRASRRRGQKGIQSDRARQIQAALIREHYLSGEPSGVWDDRTRDAMRRYQDDNGWQTKVLPDARALIKLGLGPDQSALLNPDTAATHPELQPERALARGGGADQR